MLCSFGAAPQPAGCRASTRAGLTRVMFHVVLLLREKNCAVAGFTRADALAEENAADLLFSFAEAAPSGDDAAVAQARRAALAAGGVGPQWRFRVPASRTALRAGLSGMPRAGALESVRPPPTNTRAYDW